MLKLPETIFTTHGMYRSIFSISALGKMVMFHSGLPLGRVDIYLVLFLMLETHCLFLPLLAGNFDWVGNAFTQNAGAGLVINQADAGNSTSIIKQLKAVFERDWYSHYAKSLQPTKIPNCFNHKLNKGTSNKTSMSNVN